MRRTLPGGKPDIDDRPAIANAEITLISKGVVSLVPAVVVDVFEGGCLLMSNRKLGKGERINLLITSLQHKQFTKLIPVESDHPAEINLETRAIVTSTSANEKSAFDEHEEWWISCVEFSGNYRILEVDEA